ncbi:MAG TPA: chromate efflux transporter [Treponemataceae bacterium]|nr:chromate efflux transporter [Treponemataceae bacterium]
MNKPGKNTGWGAFLADVFVCSLGAYGGPEAHYGVFADHMVSRKKHLTEEELLELIALTGILPGPSSTQTIVAIGYKVGGPVLGALTLLVWAAPVLAVMTMLSFLGAFLEQRRISPGILRYIGPMAVGFIIVAAYRLGRKAIADKTAFLLMLFAGTTTYFIHEPWIYPLVLIAGGAFAAAASKEKNIWNRIRLDPPWAYLAAFAATALAGFAAITVSDNRIVHLFESFYRYGYLVIGGGQVVVPLMFSELVEANRYMSDQEFLTGFGLVQGLPGPMFSFSAYAGGMAARGSGVLFQILGAAAGGIGIFMPGVLLIYFVYPIWENLKAIRGIRIALRGVTAAACGLIAASAVVLMRKNGFSADALVATAASAGLLLLRKIPAPVIVAACIIAGVVIPF